MSPSAASAVQHVVPPTKPLLRGWSHFVGFLLAVAATVALVSSAGTRAAFWTSLVYGLSLSTLLGTSALYHCPVWSIGARKVLRPLDHSAIFLLIAGTFTPFTLALTPAQGKWLLIIGWSMAALGMARALFWGTAPKRLVAAQAVLTGWSVVWCLPQLYRALGVPAIALIAAGGLLYTLGAVVYAFRRPNPWPRVFGFHEIFHLFVIAAAACHYAAVTMVVVKYGHA